MFPAVFTFPYLDSTDNNSTACIWVQKTGIMQNFLFIHAYNTTKQFFLWYEVPFYAFGCLEGAVGERERKGETDAVYQLQEEIHS